MLSRLGRWAGRLIGHDFLEGLAELGLGFRSRDVIVVGLGELHFRRDPVADLAPFGIVPGRRIRVRHGERELRRWVLGETAGDGVEELDGGHVLCDGGVDGVAVVCGSVGPGDGDGEEGEEGGEDGGDDFGFLESGSISVSDSPVTGLSGGEIRTRR